MRSEDLKLAVQLAIIPRSRYADLPSQPAPRGTTLQPMKAPPGSGGPRDKDSDSGERGDEEDQSKNADQEEEQHQQEEDEGTEKAEVPANIVVKPAGVVVKGSLTAVSRRT